MYSRVGTISGISFCFKTQKVLFARLTIMFVDGVQKCGQEQNVPSCFSKRIYIEQSTRSHRTLSLLFTLHALYH